MALSVISTVLFLVVRVDQDRKVATLDISGDQSERVEVVDLDRKLVTYPDDALDLEKR